MQNADGRGFTLVEILVALAILAVVLMAASRSIALSLNSASQIRMTMLAEWVAQNRAAMHRINRDWPPPGNTSGKDSQGQTEFHWTEEVSNTPHSKFRRIEIKVFDPQDDKHELRRLVTYVSSQN